MTFEIGLLLALLGVALALFSVEWIPADVVALGLLLAMVLTGLLPADKAFAGFGSDAVLMILGLLIMTAALIETGAVDLVGRGILRHGATSPQMLLLVILVTVATLSAFVSNTAAAAFFVPVVMGIAAKAKVSPSKLLMPLAFASILSSAVTLISTSSNLVVSGLMTRAGLEPMGMFELAPVGIPITVVGVLYMYFVGQRLLPDRTQAEEPMERFGVRSYLSEVLVLPESRLVGKTLRESGLGQELGLQVVRVIRGKVFRLPEPHMALQAGDVLLVEGPREEILKVKDTDGIEIRPEVTLSGPLDDEEVALVEALVVPGSKLAGRTLKGARFRERYGLQVLGMNRHGRNLVGKLAQIVLRVGDVLLVQGHRTNIAALEDERAFAVLGAIDPTRIHKPRALRASVIFLGAIVLGSAKVLSLPVATLLGGFLVLATRCVTPQDAYREVEWRVVILIACMLGLGAAMDGTGTANFLAGHVVGFVQGTGSLWLLSGFFWLTVVLTQPMSNQAAAAVLLPIAVATARQLDLEPRTFAMMIAVAASCSYLTPLEPACLMVYGPGRYRFFDFFRVGAPLTVLIYGIAIVLVPIVWPLRAG